jgi:hypothetical protein|tara:strand:+ start:204 stop:347 length:144 start_codon:yes stop_codon:yes gene_type:complete
MIQKEVGLKKRAAVIAVARSIMVKTNHFFWHRSTQRLVCRLVFWDDP